jgi:hypothetical protein
VGPRTCIQECYHDIMVQLTLRVQDELMPRLKAAAAAQGRSLNGWATAVLAAAVDPDLAGDEAERVRERLARAGLLVQVEDAPRSRPERAAVARARAAAGKGRPLSELVAEERR